MHYAILAKVWSFSLIFFVTLLGEYKSYVRYQFLLQKVSRSYCFLVTFYCFCTLE